MLISTAKYLGGYDKTKGMVHSPKKLLYKFSHFR